MWLPSTLVPGSAGLGPPLSLGAAWASPLLQGRVHGGTLPIWGQDPWSLEKAGSRRDAHKGARRLYCVGFHSRRMSRSWEGCFHPLMPSGVRDVMFVSKVCCCQFPATRPGKKRLGRGGTSPSLGRLWGGVAHLPTQPWTHCQPPTPGCSLKAPALLHSPYPFTAPLRGLCVGTPLLARGSAHPG